MKHSVPSENAVTALISWRRAAGDIDRAIGAIHRSGRIGPARSGNLPRPQTRPGRNANIARHARERSVGTSDLQARQTRSAHTPSIIHRLDPADPPGGCVLLQAYGAPRPTSAPCQNGRESGLETKGTPDFSSRWPAS